MQTNRISDSVCINGYPYIDEFSYPIEEKANHRSEITNTLNKEAKDTISSEGNKRVNKGSVANIRHRDKRSDANGKVHNKPSQMVDTISVVNIKNSDNSETATRKALDKAREIKENTDFLKEFVAKESNSKTRPNIKECLNNTEALKNEKIKEETIRANNTDCSGFIKLIYKDNPKFIDTALKNGQDSLSSEYKGDRAGFQLRLRGAELIRRGTEEVKETEVKEGDLIFFKDIKEGGRLTDYATHIGIVSKVDRDKDDKQIIHFIHKSTNGGVVESTLDSKARVNQNIRYRDLSPTYGRVN